MCAPRGSITGLMSTVGASRGQGRVRLVVALLRHRVAAGGHAEEHEAQRHVHLGRREAGALRVLQRVEHVLDQARDLGRRGVGDGGCGAVQHGMAHAGDLEYCHSDPYMAFAGPAVNRFGPAPAPRDRHWRHMTILAILRSFR